jgi:hypothetical protein
MPRAAELRSIAHLRDTGAVEIEPLVVGAGVLVGGADDAIPGPVPERARDVVLQAVVRPEEIPGEAPAVVIEDVAALLEADDGLGGTGASSSENTTGGRPSCHQVATTARVSDHRDDPARVLSQVGMADTPASS